MAWDCSFCAWSKVLFFFLSSLFKNNLQAMWHTYLQCMLKAHSSKNLVVLETGRASPTQSYLVFLLLKVTGSLGRTALVSWAMSTNDQLIAPRDSFSL